MKLLDIPYEGWQAEYDRLMKDPYLSKKYDRKRRIKEKRQYITEKLPEVKNCGGFVVDIGPGPGEFLEVCREFKNKIQGIDAKIDDCEMGDEYIQLSKLMTDRQRVPVLYNGFEDYRIPVDQKVTIINMQGSIEQVLKHILDGPSHKQTKKANKLSWRGQLLLESELEHMFKEFNRVLCDGGIVSIWANGTKEDNIYNESICDISRNIGFVLLKREGKRYHKWMKA